MCIDTKLVHRFAQVLCIVLRAGQIVQNEFPPPLIQIFINLATQRLGKVFGNGCGFKIITLRGVNHNLPGA